MSNTLAGQIRSYLWASVRVLHRWDYAYYLPWIAGLPLSVAYALQNVRGLVNGLTGRDWRSVGMRNRHIWRQTQLGYQQLSPNANPGVLKAWRRTRFRTEAREEFEAQLIVQKRVAELHCESGKADLPSFVSDTQVGTVMLTLHLDSFLLGAAFLATKTSVRHNFMSSAITRDPRVCTSVQNHFENKYRGLEHYLNGGKVVDMEDGVRPFYRMLENGETLLVMGDAPVLPQGAAMNVEFLGAQRALAAGAFRLAQKTNSRIGAYLCFYQGGANYQLRVLRALPASDPHVLADIYQFFTEAINENPGRWWAVDLLPNMPAQAREIAR